MLEIAGGIVLAVLIIFVGLPLAYILATALWRVWVTIGIGFVLAVIAAVIAHNSSAYDADGIFIVVWIGATIVIGSLWCTIHEEREKQRALNHKNET